jgi:hypothetical protein
VVSCGELPTSLRECTYGADCTARGSWPQPAQRDSTSARQALPPNDSRRRRTRDPARGGTRPRPMRKGSRCTVHIYARREWVERFARDPVALARQRDLPAPAPIASALRVASSTSSGSFPDRRTSVGPDAFAERDPETQLRDRPRESFVQIFDRLDEVGLPEDHIQLIRLVNRHRVQLELASALRHRAYQACQARSDCSAVTTVTGPQAARRGPAG